MSNVMTLSYNALSLLLVMCQCGAVHTDLMKVTMHKKCNFLGLSFSGHSCSENTDYFYVTLVRNDKSMTPVSDQTWMGSPRHIFLFSIKQTL